MALALVKLFSGSAIVPVLAAVAAAPAPARPNYLFLYTDDQRHDALSVVQQEQGERGRFPWFRTPHLDRLAAEGVRFRNAFVVSSLCAPSRAVFLTGRYNHHNGIASNFRSFPTNSVTHATLLRAAGYTTAYVGKWHMGNQRERPGFDHHASFIGHARYVDPNFIVDGTDTPTRGWIDDLSTDYAIDFLRRQRNVSRPWSLTVGFKSPHGPFDPPARAKNRFENELARAVPNLNLPPPYLGGPTSRTEQAAAGLEAAAAPGQVPVNLNYFRCLSAIDDNVGRLLDTLDDLNLATNTVVIYTSDNGFYLGEHRLGDKRSAYDESLRIPFLVRFPALGPSARGRVVDEMILNLDLAPTLLDFAGVPAPDTMQGRSWRALLTGKPTAWREAWFYEYFAEKQRNSRVPDITAVRTADAKLIRYPGRDDWTELFDLRADPYETRNLFHDPAAVSLRARLEAAHERLVIETGYRVPDFVDRPEGWSQTGGAMVERTESALPSLRLSFAAEQLDGDRLRDDSGLGNHGQARGVSRVPGRGTQAALRFDGQGFVEVPRSRSLSPAGGPWTVEAVIKADRPDGMILARGGRTHGYALWLKSGRPVFTVRVGGRQTSAESTTAISISNWTTLAGLITVDRHAELHMDGKSAARAALPGFIPADPSDTMQIGADRGSPVIELAPPPFVGLIERVRLFSTTTNTPPVTAPIAPRKDHAQVWHGRTFVDPYHWLREKGSPEVLKYLEAENAYNEATAADLKPFAAALYEEMLGRIKQTDLGVPTRSGRFHYYHRTVEGLQYPIRCRKPAGPDGSFRDDAAEEVLLDQNAMAKGLAFLAVGAFAVSDDDARLLYSTDDTGFRQYKLFVKDLISGKVHGPLAERVTGVTWAADNRTVFYVTEHPVTKRADTLWRLEIGAAPVRVHEETNELFTLHIDRTKDKKFIVLGSQSTDTWDRRLLPAAAPGGEFRLILPREKGHKYDVEHRDGVLYLRTNKDAKNFRLVTAPLDDPSPIRWKPLVEHRPDVLLDEVELFRDFVVVQEKQAGLNRLRVHTFAESRWQDVTFPEPVYTASLSGTPEFSSKLLRYRYTSFITPASILDYDMTTGTSTLLKRDEVLGGFDPGRYVSRRLWATARDGVKVPISIVYPKNFVPDGKAPLWLYAYGSYGFGMSATFDSRRLSLLDRGIPYAIAHIRGGNEMGEAWHDDGMLMKKRNSFFDFIDCAEFLVKERWTAPEGLLIEGGSAGGLLMGAVVNERPDLFRAVHAAVPFMDVMNTMMDTSLPLTVGEYLEWGNPNEKAAFDYMLSYSPYDNLAKKAYPAILVTTSYNDSQVMYWEPAKYVAKLRALKTDSNPLALKTKMEPAGHGGASGRYDALKDRAFELAWMLKQVGITR